jgi:hypothetical protein
MDFTMLIIVAMVVIPGYFIIYGLSKMLYSQADRFEEESKENDESKDSNFRDEKREEPLLSEKLQDNDAFRNKNEEK